ncbi:uncharacterized protein LOC128250041 [Octopus bimaculoides]|uniref:uncharacterized protein LOC128250041 n=1 Tax=Octopus bimaculoides TaxID=37653 RepID=UPI0022E6FE18|nr:uncharacterized protein LOC128250041 [Octopus bimaculoides]
MTVLDHRRNCCWFGCIVFCIHTVLSGKNETSTLSPPLLEEWKILYYKLPITVVVIIFLASTSILVSRLVDRVYNTYKDNWAIREDVTDVNYQTKELIRNKMKVNAETDTDDSGVTNVWLKKYINLWMQRVAETKRTERVSNVITSQHRKSVSVAGPSEMVEPDVISHVVVIEVGSSRCPSNSDLKATGYI